jgi:hypothetical protein
VIAAIVRIGFLSDTASRARALPANNVQAGSRHVNDPRSNHDRRLSNRFARFRPRIGDLAFRHIRLSRVVIGATMLIVHVLAFVRWSDRSGRRAMAVILWRLGHWCRSAMRAVAALCSSWTNPQPHVHLAFDCDVSKQRASRSRVNTRAASVSLHRVCRPWLLAADRREVTGSRSLQETGPCAGSLINER